MRVVPSDVYFANAFRRSWSWVAIRTRKVQARQNRCGTCRNRGTRIFVDAHEPLPPVRRLTECLVRDIGRPHPTSWFYKVTTEAKRLVNGPLRLPYRYAPIARQQSEQCRCGQLLPGRTILNHRGGQNPQSASRHRLSDRPAQASNPECTNRKVCPAEAGTSPPTPMNLFARNATNPLSDG